MSAFGSGGAEYELATRVTSSGFGGLESKLGSAGGALSSFKKSVGLAGGALAALSAGALAKATQSAIEFESQLSDLEKVTSSDLVGPLKEGIMDLSERIPMARKGLVELATQAGKFGAESEEEILAFTESVGKIASATSLAADEAGKRFAKIAGAIGLPMENIGQLGNAVNSLADSMKTNAGEITDTATRASNILSQQLGIGQDKVLALSASMNEASSSSRLAASSLRRMAETMMDPRKMGDMASAVGMTKDEFKAMVKTAPEKLMNRLAQAMKENGRGADILRSTIGKAANDFNKLAAQTDQTAKAQDVVNQQFEEGTSLNREMAIRTSTAAGKWQLLTNKVQNAASRIGDRLLPYVKDLLDVVIRGVDWFGRLNDKTDGFAGMITLVAGVVGGTVVALGSLVSILGASTTAVAAASGAVGALGTAFTVLTGPIGLAVAAIAGLYAAWRTNLFGIRDVTNATIGRLRTIFEENIGPIREELGILADNIRSLLMPIIESFTGFVQENLPLIRSIFQGVFSTISTLVTGVADALLKLGRIVLNIINGDFSEAWTIAKQLVKDTITGIVGWLTGTGKTLLADSVTLIARRALDIFDWLKTKLLPVIKSTISGIVTYLQTNAWGDLKAAFTVAAKGVLAAGQWLMDQLIGGEGGGGGLIGRMISSVVSFLKGIGTDDIKAAFKAIGSAIRTIVLGLVEGAKSIKSLMGKAIGAVLTYLREDAVGDLKAAGEVAFDALKTAFGIIADEMTPEDGLIVQLVSDIITYFTSGKVFEDLKKAGEAAFDGIVAAAEGLYEGLIGKSLFKDMIGDIASYLSGQAASDLAKAAKNAAKAAANALKDKFNSLLPDKISIPSVTIGGGSINLPSTTVMGQRIGGGSLNIPSQRVGGQSLSIPQLQTGGLIESSGFAWVDEGEWFSGVPAAGVDRDGGGKTLTVHELNIESDTEDPDAMADDLLAEVNARF